MSQPVSLLFGVHAHQPVGNFPEVLADAHLRCYRPFLKVLYRYPGFRFALHISGWLLNYLIDHYPEDIALLREMVMRDQVELFGAGDTEPVLAAIPNRDRIGQIEAFSEKLETKLGRRPVGAWLTERVWEATVVPALADCGIRYVIVDDYHFLCAGKTAPQLNGYFTTEEDGRVLDLFPISEALRYRVPFSPAHDVVAHIESQAHASVAGGGVAAMYFDDIEKFGIWPETYHWVYEEGWLDSFIQGVLASPLIRAQHYREYHAAEKTRGIVYLPTTSYIEMNEWTLPAQPANIYANLVRQAKAAGWYDGQRAFLRGGIWKNFFSRYPESNWMHKRMLSLSSRLALLREPIHNEIMKRKLYEAQANDAYWHGLFGGLYLPHLRRAVFRALIELETMLDACEVRAARFLEDTDLDGIEELYLQNGRIQAVLKLDGSGSICELDSYVLKHNFGDTLKRQVEHYHEQIYRSGSGGPQHSGGGIASAHERVSFKHKIDAVDLEADDHARSLFVDRLNGGFVAYLHPTFPAEGTEDVGWTVDLLSEHVQKNIELAGNGVYVSYRFPPGATGVFSTEINLAMPSCDGWGGRYIQDGTVLCGFGQLLELSAMAGLTLDDNVLGGSVKLKISSPVALIAQPCYSVSQSEGGFEKIMQAVTLTLEWPLTLGDVAVSLEVGERQDISVFSA
jgi:4-alpha-glucanotransferase/alpha-amylase